jgi:hypothetical protein
VRRAVGLVANPSKKISDLLFRADGIVPECSVSAVKNATITPRKATTTKDARSQIGCLAKMHPTAGTGLCTPTYFVDGHEWAPLGKEPQDVLEDAFGSLQIKGIEVYDGQRPRPLRFQGSPSCGAVVIWTK